MGLLDLWKKLLGQDRPEKKKSRSKLKKRPAKKTKRKTAKKPRPKTRRPKKKTRRVVRKRLPRLKSAVKKKKPLKPAVSRARPPGEEEIGVITHYFGKISVGIIKLKKPLKAGEKIHIKGAHDDFTQVVKSMQHNHRDIAIAKKGLEVGVRVTRPVHENDKVYRV